MNSEPDSKLSPHQLELDLGKSTGPRFWKNIKLLGALIVLAALALVIVRLQGTEAVHYKTQSVKTGPLTILISATGTLKPLHQVDVGCEISGLVDQVLVDYNDPVKKGQVLARLNKQQLEANRMRSAASLVSAQANQYQAQVTLSEVETTHRRTIELSREGIGTQVELDAAKAMLLRAQAALSGAKAQVVMAQAQLNLEQLNLEKAEIRSPIDGVVISRQVEPGQTVAASLQAPVLFVLAEDLSQMELLVDIDEADIGTVKTGQKATFRVDAFLDINFKAQIQSIRNAPRTIQGVVTYEAVLSLQNAEMQLRPGMTATAEITTHYLPGALLVPTQPYALVHHEILRTRF